MQLDYTIRRCDLKPVHNDAGPQLIQNHCSEIESKTQTSIQFEQRSNVVEFHIAGLEEDVTRAMHLIREEFKVSYSSCVVTLADTVACLMQKLYNCLYIHTETEKCH